MSKVTSSLVHKEKMGLLEGLVLEVLKERFLHSVTGAWEVAWRPGDGGEEVAVVELGGGGA
jgi:hypothetical protein